MLEVLKCASKLVMTKKVMTKKIKYKTTSNTQSVEILTTVLVFALLHIQTGV